MATKSIYADMLNQTAAQDLQKDGAPLALPAKPQKIRRAKAPGAPEFAYLSPKDVYRHPLQNRGRDISAGIWAHMVGSKKGRA